ncbi:hypothetical protein VTG60DRAFT_3410 [Thermothelomyces hinnuleus]
MVPSSKGLSWDPGTSVFPAATAIAADVTAARCENDDDEDGDKAIFVVQRQFNNSLIGILPGVPPEHNVGPLSAGDVGTGAYILNDTDLQGLGVLGSEKILFRWKEAVNELLLEEKLDAFFPPIRKREYWSLHLDNNRWPQPDTFQVVDDEE